MSPPKSDRTFRSGSGSPIHGGEFAAAIAAALHSEFGESSAAVKQIVRATGANERAARNWFDGKNAPSGEFLIALCRSCDQVLETVLLLSGRDDILKAKRLADARGKLIEVMNLIDEITQDTEQ